MNFLTASTEKKGVDRAIEDFSLPKNYLFKGNYSRTSGYQFAKHYFKLKERPTAVLAANDRMAIGFMQGLWEHGQKPGKDVAIVGYDNTDTAELLETPLSSVAVPFF